MIDTITTFAITHPFYTLGIYLTFLYGVYTLLYVFVFTSDESVYGIMCAGKQTVSEYDEDYFSGKVHSFFTALFLPIVVVLYLGWGVFWVLGGLTNRVKEDVNNKK